MNLRDASRDSYGATGIGGPSFESINAGSLQRIADAVEKMASSYDAMRNERDRYKRWYEEEQENCKAQDRANSALRGVITRMKRKAAAR